MKWLVFIIFTWSSAVAIDIPAGYVFDVQPTCSADVNGITSIHVLTDLDVHVEGECKDGYIAQFNTLNYVDWFLNATYKGDSLHSCMFVKKNVSNAYILYLSVSWAEPGEVMLNHDIYMITCVLDPHSKTKSKIQTISKGVLGPRELQSHMGGDATSSFSLKLTDVAGKELKSGVPLGRKVQLSAKMLVSKKPGAKNEVGLRAINCAATSKGGSYKILRGGCGDGIVLPRNMGFMTKGIVTTSPIFTAFRMADSKMVSFSCNFTTCTKNCDGDSCLVEKSKVKRSTGEPEQMIHMLFDMHVRSVDGDEVLTRTEDGQSLAVRSVETPLPGTNTAVASDDTVEVDPCDIPGIEMKGCQSSQFSPEQDFPVVMTSLMVVIMVVFPMLLVIGLTVFFCCSKTESYGLNDGGQKVTAT